MCAFQPIPGLGALGLLAGQAGFTKPVVDDFHRHLDLVADGQFEITLIIQELDAWDDAFGLESGMYGYPVSVDIHHGAGNDGAWRHFDGGQTLGKKISK